MKDNNMNEYRDKGWTPFTDGEASPVIEEEVLI